MSDPLNQSAPTEVLMQEDGRPAPNYRGLTGSDAPIVVRASRRKAAILLAATATFAAIGAAMTADRQAAFAGWYCLVFFGFCALVAVAQLVFASRLTLSPEGMRLEHFGRTRLWRWDRIGDVRVWTAFSNQFVTFDDLDARPGALRKINRGLGAGTSALPPSWSLKAQRLADLIESCRQRWGGGGG